jgi:hypothetical protein
LKGAYITSYRLTCGGANAATNASGKLYNVESANFIFYITDSRGYTNSRAVNLYLIDYVKPTCNQSVKMELVGETGAKAIISLSGNYFSGHFGATGNSLTLQYRKKEEGGEWGPWFSLPSQYRQINDRSYTAEYTITGLSYDKSYTFQSAAIDATGETNRANSTEYIARLIPVFDWGENDFNFNVPVSFQGDTMADFIVEQGTEAMGSNGTWYWEKWKSGKAVCYGRRNFGNMGVSTAWGSLYHSNTFSQSFPSGLFSETPSVIDIRVISNSNYAGWVVQGFDAAASQSSTGSFRMTSVISATFSQVHFCFNIIGRWK